MSSPKSGDTRSDYDPWVGHRYLVARPELRDTDIGQWRRWWLTEQHPRDEQQYIAAIADLIAISELPGEESLAAEARRFFLDCVPVFEGGFITNGVVHRTPIGVWHTPILIRENLVPDEVVQTINALTRGWWQQVLVVAAAGSTLPRQLTTAIPVSFTSFARTNRPESR